MKTLTLSIAAMLALASMADAGQLSRLRGLAPLPVPSFRPILRPAQAYSQCGPQGCTVQSLPMYAPPPPVVARPWTHALAAPACAGGVCR